MKVLKIKPQAQEKKSVLRISTKETPKPAITADTVKALVADGISAWTESFRAELRKLSGKVTN